MLLKSLSLCLLVLLFLVVFNSHGKDTINWQTYHRPPGIIMTGPNVGLGFVQKVNKLIIDRIPEYHHEMPLTTVGRALSDMKAGKHVCHPALFITPERKKFMLFSDASMINPSNRLVAKQGVLDQFSTEGGIDIQTLLTANIFTFALINKRSYTDVIDEILFSHVDVSKVHWVSNTDLTTIFQLINRDRVDLSILYPFELEYYLANSDISKQSLASYKIKGVPHYNIGAVACPKNEWGSKVIQKVNEILKQIKNTKEYKEAVTTWWQDEAKTPEFKAFYKDVFLTH